MDTLATKKPPCIVLIVLDGWGIAPPGAGNAIARAETPVMDDLVKRYPAAVLQAAGESVGLPWGDFGNSEVGHFALGTGRLVYHTLLRINRDIWTGDFFNNTKLVKAANFVKQNKSALHLIGMVSSGGVHSYLDHLYALLDFAKKEKIKKVYLHCILDGRDTPYNSGRDFIKLLQDRLQGVGVGEIATLHGRFFAMDRDNHWERTNKSYDAIVSGVGKHVYSNALDAIDYFYDKKIYDEHIEPIVIQTEQKKPIGSVSEKDAVIFFNYRADRMRQLAHAFIQKKFDHFQRIKKIRTSLTVTFTEYDPAPTVPVAFSSVKTVNSLAEVLSKNNLKQLHIAETEKYAHVTYFFNGGQEKKIEGEDHILVPSSRDARYDEVPEMSAAQITTNVVSAVGRGEYDFIIANFANADMVGHTAHLKATMRAVENVDTQIGLIHEAVLAQQAILLITADHGNAEILLNAETGQLQKEHTTKPVPFIIISDVFEGKTLGFPDAPGGDLSLVISSGLLSDVAPTILKLFGIKKPKEMTGHSLI